MKYGKVQNNAVSWIGELPDSYGKVGCGFRNLTDTQLAEYGFYPVDDSEPVLEPGQRKENKRWELDNGTIYKKYDIYQYNEPTLLPYQKKGEVQSWEQDASGIYQGTYEVIDITVDEYKEKKKGEIKRELQTAREQGLSVSLGFKIDIMQENVIDWQGNYEAMKLKGLTETNVRDYDNKLHTISFSDYETMMGEIFDKISSLYNTKWSLDDQVEASTTLDEIYNITISY